MSTKKTAEKTSDTRAGSIQIKAPNEEVAQFKIVGTAPYVQLAFGQKAKEKMRADMESGQKKTKGAKRPPRDFDADYAQALHHSREGWCGIPAPALRCAMISACKSIGFHMTKAKLAVFVEADGIDPSDGTPLVKIAGKPEKVEHIVRNANGNVDIRVRGMFSEWSASVRVRYDADLFSREDVANLLHRAGRYVGIGEGRPDSKSSAGMGWGTFTLT